LAGPGAALCAAALAGGNAALIYTPACRNYPGLALTPERHNNHNQTWSGCLTNKPRSRNHTLRLVGTMACCFPSMRSPPRIPGAVHRRQREVTAGAVFSRDADSDREKLLAAPRERNYRHHRDTGCLVESLANVRCTTQKMIPTSPATGKTT